MKVVERSEVLRENWKSEILYQSSASMIQKHLPGICNYFENHTTGGLIEGMNTKIKLIKRISYEFTN
ncbi:MAG: hypothetical protein EWV60_10575 [Microcystis sp. Msp_OC_L_20101000_S702]|nr:MAG: hypothetical protein DWQ56_06530 [Microcystis aeruginosa DA14]TRU09853.1 MAG: hypothetical protein EWV60_10575 [Microcystis sp. Msp_OC_L_20101000_S702]